MGAITSRINTNIKALNLWE